MKTLSFTILFILALSGIKVSGQGKGHWERHGDALNLGVGLGYYGYVGHSMPVLHADYEFDVARNFTLAPFINYFSYSNHYYWGDPHNPYRYYSYRETVIPVGVKGTYYFDQLFGAGPHWDFYTAGSLGFAFRKTTWEDGYYGETVIRRGTGALYLDLHLGTEYHFNKKTGIFLDLSTGVSTLGISFHM